MESKLKIFRESQNLSQKEMSEKLGVSLSYYSKVENGVRNSSFDFLKKIKETFPDISIDNTFFTGKFPKISVSEKVKDSEIIYQITIGEEEVNEEEIKKALERAFCTFRSFLLES